MQLTIIIYIHHLQPLLGPFNGLFSRTTGVSRHQKGKPFWIYWSKRWRGGSGISWTIRKSFAPCSRQITMPLPHHSVFTGWMPFLTPNQQRQSTEGNIYLLQCHIITMTDWNVDLQIRFWVTTVHQRHRQDRTDRQTGQKVVRTVLCCIVYYSSSTQNGLLYTVGPLSCLSVCPILSVTLVHCGQTVRQIKMKLGMQVGLIPACYMVLDGDSASPHPNGHSPQFSAHICCGQIHAWIKMQLGMEVGNFQNFRRPVTLILTLYRVKVISTSIIRVGLPACLTMWL